MASKKTLERFGGQGCSPVAIYAQACSGIKKPPLYGQKARVIMGNQQEAKKWF